MRINESVLREGGLRYGVDVSRLHPLGGKDVFSMGESHSAVFAGECDGRAIVLKFASAPVGQLEEARERWDFVRYLAECGGPVTRPIVSANGRVLETFEGGGDEAVTLVVTEKAEGRHIYGQSHACNDAFIHTWGRTVGRLHALAKGYLGGAHLPDWQDEFTNLATLCDDEAVLARWQALEAYMQTLPRTPDGFGLVHNDLHPENFLYNDGRITVIDFDVCHRHWFVLDIAMAVYTVASGMVLPADPALTGALFVERFFDQFMAGYCRENTLDGFWLRQMPQFLMHRMILPFLLYAGEMRKTNHPNYEPWRNAIVNNAQVTDPALWVNR